MRRLSRVSTTPASMPPAPRRDFPVVGICEAALVTAGQIAKRIAIVTTLPRSIVPLQELVRRYGFAERARVTACDVAVLDLEKPGSGAEAKLEAEISRALDKGAEAIVLGCAGMADLAHKLSHKFGVPVVDGVAAAVKQAEALAGLKLDDVPARLLTRRRERRLTTGLLAPFAPENLRLIAARRRSCRAAGACR